jgi:metal-sulfur cluster biosynthetic enzyme
MTTTGTIPPASLGTSRDEAVWEVLGSIPDPCSIATGVPISLVEMGIVTGVEVEGRTAIVSLQLTSPICMQVPTISAAVEEGIRKLDGLDGVELRIGSSEVWTPERMSPAARQRLGEARRWDRHARP